MHTDCSVSDLIRLLDLKPHPEGGHYRETLRDNASGEGRAASTAIYFLLGAGEESRWHRIDSVEVWHWYGGAPLLLSMSEDGHDLIQTRLGMDLTAGERPRASVPGNAWKSAGSLVCGPLSAAPLPRVSSSKNSKSSRRGHVSIFNIYLK